MDEYEVFEASLIATGYSEEAAKTIVEMMREKETNYKEGNK